MHVNPHRSSRCTTAGGGMMGVSSPFDGLATALLDALCCICSDVQPSLPLIPKAAFRLDEPYSLCLDSLLWLAQEPGRVGENTQIG